MERIDNGKGMRSSADVKMQKDLLDCLIDIDETKTGGKDFPDHSRETVVDKEDHDCVYMCSLCSVEVDSKNEFKSHFLQHFDEKDAQRLTRQLQDKDTFTCPLCGYQDPQKLSLLRHIEGTHLGLEVNCSIVQIKAKNKWEEEINDSRDKGTKDESKEDEKLAIKKEEKIKRMDADDDESLLASKESEEPQQKEEKLPEKEEMKAPFVCIKCSREFDTELELSTHKLSSHNNKSLKCPFCTYEIADQIIFINHVNSHDESMMEYSTSKKKESLKESAMENTTKDNIKLEKNELDEPVWYQGSDLKFYCKYCSYMTDVKLRIEYHANIHTDKKQYICDMCGFRCKIKQILNFHMKTHYRRKRTKCNFCSYSSNINFSLKSHLKKHETGQLHTECKTCFKVFPNIEAYYNRDNHLCLQKLEDEAADDASTQECVANSKVNLSSALKCQLENLSLPSENEATYSCNDCNFSSERKCALSSHVKVHLNEPTFYKSEVNVETCNKQSKGFGAKLTSGEELYSNDFSHANQEGKEDDLFEFANGVAMQIAMTEKEKGITHDMEKCVADTASALLKNAQKNGQVSFAKKARTHRQEVQVPSLQFRCSKCTSTFENEDSYKLHKKTHKKKNKIKMLVGDFVISVSM